MDVRTSLATIVTHLEEAQRSAAERKLSLIVYLIGMALFETRRESYRADEEPEPARPNGAAGDVLAAFAR